MMQSSWDRCTHAVASGHTSYLFYKEAVNANSYDEKVQDLFMPGVDPTIASKNLSWWK